MTNASTSFIPAAVVVGIAALAACASTDYHYSQLYGTRYFRTPIDTYSVTIVSVDGKDTVIRPVTVEAGLRKIVVQGPPPSIGGLAEQREIELDIAPCTRYYLVAVKDNRLASDFTIRIDYQEPVGGCTPAAVNSPVSS